MGSKRSYKRQLTVRLEYAPTRDADRLSRAIAILLKAAGKANAYSKDTPNGKKEAPHGQDTAKDALTRSNGGNNSNDTGITQT